MKITFVCTGNTCRSPMAEALCRKLLSDKETESVTVASAGLFPQSGDVTSRLAVQALHEEGIDIQPKKAVLLTQKLADESDLIAVMTERHAELIRQSFLHTEGKLRVLNIDDPYGGNLDDYRQCCWQLEREIKRLLRKEKVC